jgi:hypothetical protein
MLLLDQHGLQTSISFISSLNSISSSAKRVICLRPSGSDWVVDMFDPSTLKLALSVMSDCICASAGKPSVELITLLTRKASSCLQGFKFAVGTMVLTRPNVNARLMRPAHYAHVSLGIGQNPRVIPACECVATMRTAVHFPGFISRRIRLWRTPDMLWDSTALVIAALLVSSGVV